MAKDGKVNIKLAPPKNQPTLDTLSLTKLPPNSERAVHAQNTGTPLCFFTDTAVPKLYREVKIKIEESLRNKIRQQTIPEPEVQENQEELGYTEEDPSPPAKMKKLCGLTHLL
ncbi:zinc finger BED domain-containing protein 1-like, partial [Scomber scombrus]